MNVLELLVVLVLSAVARAGLARKLRIAYPVGLVLGGFALGFVLELPRVELEPGARHLRLFLAFGVISCTLILQGLTLAPLIRRLGVETDARCRDEEGAARTAMAHAALAEIDRIAAEQPVSESYIAYLRALRDTSQPVERRGRAPRRRAVERADRAVAHERPAGRTRSGAGLVA
jgi:NhaP-type Na+/H+ or K+/H+ antiporter